MPATCAARRDVAEDRLDLLAPRPAGHREEARHEARLEHVDVERDVDRVGTLERTPDVVVDPVLGDIGRLRCVEVACPDEREVRRRDRALLERQPQRHPPRVPRRRALGCVQVSVRVEPDDREPPVTSREPADRADVRAAAPAEHERPPWQSLRDRRGLLLERRLGDDERLRVPERRVRGGRHRLPAHAPGAWHAHETGDELGAAAVTLVAVVEGDGGQGAAVRALGAERAQRRLSQMFQRQRTRMPARS